MSFLALKIKPWFTAIIVALTLFGGIDKAESCEVNSLVNGQLTISSDGLVLSSTNNQGSFILSYYCSGGSLMIESINDLLGTNPVDKAEVIIYDPSRGVVVTANNQDKPPPQYSSPLELIGDQSYFVDLTLSNTSRLIPAGNYSYQIKILLVPL